MPEYPTEPICDAAYHCSNPDHPKNEYGHCDLPTDCGVMPENIAELAEHVVGHRIVSAKKVLGRTSKRGYGYGDTLVLTLDNNKQVELINSTDCCAFTTLESFLLHPERVDHIITGVGSTDGYQRWHIYADMGDVLELEVEWSCGNPFYYGYGFHINVKETAT